MKALLLVGGLVAICTILFVVGLLSPSRSRRMQRGVDRSSREAERRADQRAGPVGDATKSGLRFMRRSADKSAQTGRQAHDRISS